MEPETAAVLRRICLRDRFPAALQYPESRGTDPVDDVDETIKGLFLRGEKTAVDQVIRLVSPHDVDVLVRSGLLALDGGSVRSNFKVQFYQGMIFLADFLYYEKSPDFVLPIGPAGYYLSNLTVRRGAASALDLGCGCGVQSLLAARHCARVTATDVNPRALALTRLNAELNGLSNIEVLAGSYFEPVAERRFDLIVANLPYVIAPGKRAIYRDTDHPGDAGLRRLVREMPVHLTEGGYAHVLANWTHTAREPWWQPMRTAVERTQADAWLVYNGSKEPQAYAEMWIRDDDRLRARTISSWVKWYRRHGIERIALGALTLRRRGSNSNWFCAAPVDSRLEDPAGDQLQRLFAAQDALSALKSPEDLFAHRLIPCRMEMTRKPDGQRVSVHATSGLRLQAEILLSSARVVESLQAGADLRTAVHQAGREEGLAPEKIPAVCLVDVQRLVDLGLVLLD